MTRGGKRAGAGLKKPLRPVKRLAPLSDEAAQQLCDLAVAGAHTSVTACAEVLISEAHAAMMDGMQPPQMAED